MTVEGRISVDCVFHDKDGTSAVNVVSLNASDEYSSGKVAVITGTLAAYASETVPLTPTAYRDAAGNLVSFSSVSRVVAKAGGGYMTVDTGQASVLLFPGAAPASFSAIIDPNNDETISIIADVQSCSYTIILYGS